MRGPFTFTKDRAEPRTGARRDLQKERFGAYFPRVFAYVCPGTRDEAAARQVVAAAFVETFALPDLREEEFEVELFQAARRLASSGEFRARRHADGLNAREREVISLVFDAQLDRAQIGRVLAIREETVIAALMRGLRKIQAHRPAEGAGATVPSYS